MCSPGGNVGLREPFGRQVAAARRIVLAQVAGDIGKLERETEIARAVERIVVLGRHAHDPRHHHPDGAGDVEAVAHEVGFAARPPAFGVEREAVDHVAGHFLGQPGFERHLAERVERHVRRRLAVERAAGEHTDRLDPALRGGFVELERAAVILAVGNIVAAAAPRVEQPGLLARGFVEQPAGEREALAAASDRLPRQRHQFLPLAPAADLPGRRAQDTRRRKRTRAEGTRWLQSSSAFIRKIGVCGR